MYQTSDSQTWTVIYYHSLIYLVHSVLILNLWNFQLTNWEGETSKIISILKTIKYQWIYSNYSHSKVRDQIIILRIILKNEDLRNLRLYQRFEYSKDCDFLKISLKIVVFWRLSWRLRYFEDYFNYNDTLKIIWKIYVFWAF